MREFRNLTMLISLMTVAAFAMLLFSTSSLLSFALEEKLRYVGDELSHNAVPLLIDNHSQMAQSLGLSLLEIREADTLDVSYMGAKQHWLIDVITPHLNNSSQLTVDEYRITYLPSYQATGNLFQSLLLTIGLTLLALLVLICSLIAHTLRGIQKRLILSLQDTPSQAPTLGRVTDIIDEQKKAFHHQLQKQRKEIEKLLHQINLDEMTGLRNRHVFRQNLAQLLNQKNTNALLVYVRASQLANINHLSGHQGGDKYLSDLTNILIESSLTLVSAYVYRVSGTDFAIICNKFNPGNFEQIAHVIHEKIEHYRTSNQLDNAAFLGLTPIVGGETIEVLIGRAELALAKAQTHSPNTWMYQKNNADKDNLAIEQWQTTINNVLTSGAINLYQQPVQSMHRNMRPYQELLSRFVTSEGKMLPTDETISMAIKLELFDLLEKRMLYFIFTQISNSFEKHIYWGINLSGLAIQNPAFINWLEEQIKQYPSIQNRLVFEVEELLVDTHLNAFKRFAVMLRRYGCRLALSRYGRGIASFRLFKELRPNYIKIDSELISGIDTDETQQQFVRMIVEIAHRVGCQVIAEGVETLSQKQVLETMYVDGLQGYLVSKPKPHK